MNVLNNLSALYFPHTDVGPEGGQQSSVGRKGEAAALEGATPQRGRRSQRGCRAQLAALAPVVAGAAAGAHPAELLRQTPDAAAAHAVDHALAAALDETGLAGVDEHQRRHLHAFAVQPVAGRDAAQLLA